MERDIEGRKPKKAGNGMLVFQFALGKKNMGGQQS